jgi:hypothetical protein
MNVHYFPCPNCNTPLDMDAEALVNGRVIDCDQCHNSVKLSKDHFNHSIPHSTKKKK